MVPGQLKYRCVSCGEGRERTMYIVHDCNSIEPHTVQCTDVKHGSFVHFTVISYRLPKITLQFTDGHTRWELLNEDSSVRRDSNIWNSSWLLNVATPIRFWNLRPMGWDNGQKSSIFGLRILRPFGQGPRIKIWKALGSTTEWGWKGGWGGPHQVSSELDQNC